MDPLAVYVDAWKRSAVELEELLRQLDEEDWARETDCPGWTVRDVVAHLAAIESELAGDPGPDVDLAGPGSREVTTAYTDAGIAARRDRTPAQLVTELVDAVHRRAAELDAGPPIDPAGTPVRNPGGIGWDWQTLLRNRAVDMWVHEQDIRRATKRPGGMDSPGADVVSATFAAALPFVIGKRVGAAPGTSVVVALDAESRGYVVDSDGRCRPADRLPEDPTVRLAMDTETFTVLAAGRRDPLTVDVGISGDSELAERILHALAVTP